MKIIHTSDWHLGDRLHGWDRSDEEERFFELLEEVVAQERPDALLVSGDIFDTGTPGNDVAKKFNDALLDISEAFDGMETVVIAGNHDSYSRLVIDESLWKRHRVHVFGVPAEDLDGNAQFAKNIVEIPAKGLIAAVPFCHERNFPAAGEGGENRAREYFAGMAKYVAGRAGNLPRILMAHLAVGRDTDFTGQDRYIAIGGQECVEPEILGCGYDYIALGHIHCPQWVGGGGEGARRIARYCGTPRAINFDETYYPHGVDIVEVSAGQAPTLRTRHLEEMRKLFTVGGKEGVGFETAIAEISSLALPQESYIRLNVALGENGAVGPDWAERARRACAERGYRYCTINPIREQRADSQVAAKALSVAELKELSDEKVVEILSERRSLSSRQRELVSELMKEVAR